MVAASGVVSNLEVMGGWTPAFLHFSHFSFHFRALVSWVVLEIVIRAWRGGGREGGWGMTSVDVSNNILPEGICVALLRIPPDFG